MTIAHLILTWLLALPPLPDGNGAPIPRREVAAVAIANAAAETERPQFWAAVLDVFAAYESGYGDETAAGGCPGVRVGTLCVRGRGARYCSPWMIECSRVPVASTLLAQARLAIAEMRRSFTWCAEFPFGQYSGVGCHSHPLVTFRTAAIRREMAIPLQEPR